MMLSEDDMIMSCIHPDLWDRIPPTKKILIWKKFSEIKEIASKKDFLF